MADAVIVVAGLAISPVKGTRLHAVDELRLECYGVRGNRRFYLIDERARMINGKQLGELNAIVADYSCAERRLTLTFLDGRVVEGVVALGASVATRFYSGSLAGRLVDGPWSAALSEYAGQPLRLVDAGDGGAVDRGASGAVSLISRASLARLATVAGQSEVDSRRFRMLIEIEGVGAHAEDAWVGRRVRVGEALVAFNGHVGRCLVTSRHPETGRIDLPTLELLGRYRGELDTTEPLPFGVYGEAVSAGTIRLGDAVEPVGS